MLYLFDNAITDDLRRSLNPKNVSNPVVKVVDPESVIGLAAQIQNDEIEFPIVALTRDPETPVDTSRTNFTMMHRGVQAVFDSENNILYHEKAIPIKLSYKLTVLTTNTADIDELIKELMFKYTTQYFLTITLPYESNRKMRFGITLDKESTPERTSGSSEYFSQGTLHQTILSLRCEGAVMLHYTPVKLRKTEYEIEPNAQHK